MARYRNFPDLSYSDQTDWKNEEKEDLLAVIFSLEQVAVSIWLGWRSIKEKGALVEYNPCLSGVLLILGHVWSTVRNWTRSENAIIAAREVVASRKGVYYYTMAHEQAGESKNFGLIGFAQVIAFIQAELKYRSDRQQIQVPLYSVRNTFPVLICQAIKIFFNTCIQDVWNLCAEDKMSRTNTQQLRNETGHYQSQNYILQMVKITKDCNDQPMTHWLTDHIFYHIIKHGKLQLREEYSVSPFDIHRFHERENPLFYVEFLEVFMDFLMDGILDYDEFTRIKFVYQMLPYIHIKHLTAQKNAVWEYLETFNPDQLNKKYPEMTKYRHSENNRLLFWFEQVQFFDNKWKEFIIISDFDKSLRKIVTENKERATRTLTSICQEVVDNKSSILKRIKDALGIDVVLEKVDV